MGPDLKNARRLGRQVGEDLLVRLIEENKLWDLDNVNLDPDGKLRMLPGAKKRWSKTKEEFICAVEELFVEDECNGF